MIVSHNLRVFLSRNKCDVCVIKGFGELAQVKGREKSFSDRRANNMPMALKRLRHTIQAYGLGQVHLFEGNKDFSFCEITREISTHHLINSRIDPREEVHRAMFRVSG